MTTKLSQFSTTVLYGILLRLKIVETHETTYMRM